MRTYHEQHWVLQYYALFYNEPSRTTIMCCMYQGSLTLINKVLINNPPKPSQVKYNTCVFIYIKTAKSQILFQARALSVRVYSNQKEIEHINRTFQLILDVLKPAPFSYTVFSFTLVLSHPPISYILPASSFARN